MELGCRMICYVVLLSLAWGWRTAMFQLFGLCCSQDFLSEPATPMEPFFVEWLGGSQ